MTSINANQNIYIQDDGIGNIEYKLGLSGTYLPLSFPCTINNTSAPTNITVFFTTNLTFNNSNQYFVCGSSNIIFDGAQYTITLNGITNYDGLIQNGTFISDGNNNITVQGFIVSSIGSSLSSDAGYVCQSYFAKNKINNIVQNCSSDGIIGGSGGICGSYAAYSTGNLSILNCHTTGLMNGTYTGGICGANAGNGVFSSSIGTVNITNCYSTGGIQAPYGGGICGFNAGNVNITNCYSIGSIGVTSDYANGGIVGGYSANNGGTTVVSNCYSLGTIGTGNISGAPNSGIVGTFASSGGTLEINDCYSFGNINTSASGICGAGDATITINNCYSIGNIPSNASGISGFSSGTLNINNCYTIGVLIDGTSVGIANTVPGVTITNSFASGTGIWSDITANTYLTGTPVSGSPIVLGPVWNSITPNTPYLLATFDDTIYNPSSVTTSTLVGGVYTSPQGLFINSGTSYQLINNTDVQITINTNNGIITFNLGIDPPTATYNPKVFVSANLGGFFYYGYNFNSFTLNYVQYIPPTPISYICFPENTPIKVDQGIISIQKINPSIHTINNKKIVAITKTISRDNYLVCFEKNSLKLNYPTARTIMSKNHKLLYAGKMIEADYFAKRFDFIEKIKYNGEFLYNVLMEEPETMSVNNIICETLHPKNMISLLYNSKIDNIYKKKITEIINNNCLKKERENPRKVRTFHNMTYNF